MCPYETDLILLIHKEKTKDPKENESNGNQNVIPDMNFSEIEDYV